MHNDSVKTSIAKTITWYLLDLFFTLGIAFAVTRDIGASFLIGLIQQTWEVALYYSHERLWVRFKKKKSS
jgi:uncharacterized membrane protein